MRTLPQWYERLLLSLVNNLSIYKSSGTQNPHKALMLILMLEEHKNSGLVFFEYGDFAAKLKLLIKRFSTSKQSHPEYPFWYLQNDHLIEVFYLHPLKFRKDKDFPPHKSLLESKATAKFPFWIEKLLKKDSLLASRIQEIIAVKYVKKSLMEILSYLRA
jgi:hypothetical protein